MNKLFRINELAKERGINGEKLANHLNVNPQTISNINTGRKYPSFKLLLRIADHLEVDLIDLFIQKQPDNTNDKIVKRLNQLRNIIDELEMRIISGDFKK